MRMLAIVLTAFRKGRASRVLGRGGSSAPAILDGLGASTSWARQTSFPRTRESSQMKNPALPDPSHRLPARRNSWIIGGAEASRESADMAWQPAGTLKTIRYRRPIFMEHVCRLSILFNSLVDRFWAEVRISGASASIFNTRRFRRLFSSYVNEADCSG